VFGDGVNIASRIESMGIPGCILVSKAIRNQLSNKSEFQLTSLGSFEFKNVNETLEVFAVANKGLVVPSRADLKGKGKQAKQKRPIWQTLTAVILLAVGFIFAGSYFFSGESYNAPVGNEFGIKSTMAVFPFDIKGSPDIEYLGEGLVDLISTQLDEIPTLRSVDPNVLISRVSSETPQLRNPEAYAKLSSNLGASKFILGSVIALGKTLQFSATKYSSDGKKIITHTIKDNQQSDLAATVDELIKNLVAEELKETGFEMGSLGAMTSDNMESLKYYLQGEQAYRRSRNHESERLFKQAVELDSTFALAWLRLGETGGNIRWINSDIGYQNWSKYIHTMPQKWQDYHYAFRGYGPVKDKVKRLAEKYDQSAEIIGKYGQFLYGGGNTYFGGSCIEGKPYLLKALELDPNNTAPIETLIKIAVIESDSAAIQHYLSIVDTTYGKYHYLKLAELMFMDTLTDQQIQEFMDVYSPKIGWLYVALQLPENEVVNLSLLERLLKARHRPDRTSEITLREIKYGSTGQEKEFYKFSQEPLKLGSIDFGRFVRCLPATFMGNDGFAPFSEHYDSLYIQTKDGETPWELYAAIKYALALNMPEEAKVLKHKLRLLGNDQAISKAVRYFDFSVQAFEARQAGNDDLALTHIDSAFQYMFSLFWAEGMATRLDKTIMAANIYAGKGDYEKAISMYNPSQLGPGLPTFRGYATYQLSNWYEQIGDSENALIKSNLFLESYKNCDEKYKPWVEEVKARKERLIAKMN
ncbi:MAG: hypothetical protein HKN53_06330, partial [Maribacter sp.]|nr:hypothetical protein [Maribacter sp.]